MTTSPSTITSLGPNEVFVFGSNEAGIHGAGAARLAFDRFGAEWGAGNGPTGQCYAIPTKDYSIHTLPLEDIKPYVDEFLELAKLSPHKKFLVTQIGCGLAGYEPKDIAPMFKGCSDNVHLPAAFLPFVS